MGLFDIFRRKKSEEAEQVKQEPATVASESKATTASESTTVVSESEASTVVVSQSEAKVPELESETSASKAPESEAPESEVPESETPEETEPRAVEEVPVEPEPVETVPESAEAPVVQPAVDAVDEKADEKADEEVEAAYDEGLKKTRLSFGERFNRLMANFRTVDESFFEQLEDTLISADVGFEIALQISDELRDEVKLKNAKRKEDVQNVIVEKLVNVFDELGGTNDVEMKFAPQGPTVIMFVGVNGVGKTTTIGKMAARYQQEGKSILLAAADTFRAGATQQLQEWGKRDGVPVVAGKPNADPASVVYDAVQRAIAEQTDVLFIDTAGRLQNNVNLMQELEKMKRQITRELPDAPQEVLLVLDATTGQNALQQAKLFKDSTDVTGIVLTKMDGTAKGGIVLAIRKEMQLPVKWIGFGEKVSDLRPFDTEAFVYGLFKELIEV